MAYIKPTISGYNSSPPSDDGANTSANEVKWATHKDKLGDPVKNYADAINQEVADKCLARSEVSTNTTTDVLSITADSLTTGDGIKLSSNSSDTGVRNLLELINDHASATGVTLINLDQDANQISINIDSEATTANAVEIDCGAQTSGNGIYIHDVGGGGAVTTGRLAYLYSNSAQTNAHNLLEVVNDNALATGAIPLRIQQDSTAEAVKIEKTTTDGGFFNFSATADADATSAISTLTTSGGTTHHIQVEINGTKAWIAASTTSPS